MKNSVFALLALVAVIFISGCTTAQDGGPISQFVTDPVEDSTIGKETFFIQGSYFPKDQFRVSNNLQDNCGAAHYHANTVTSVCGEPKTDPSPESCGFGKVSEVPEVGIFACRCPQRPNPIGLSTCKLLSIKNNVVAVRGLDVIDGTHILDIKPYTPQYDAANKVKVPEWVGKLDY